MSEYEYGLLPIMPAQCKTCPFWDDGYAEVRGLLMLRSLGEATPICHSTGDKPLTNKPVFKDSHLCRGARDFQIRFFHRIGFIESPTDEAWFKKLAEINARKAQAM